MIDPLQPLHHGLFHHGLNIRRAEQTGLDAGCLGHPELPVLRYVLLPGDGFGSLEQLLKALRLKFPCLYQDPLPGPQENIGPAKRLLIPHKSHPAVRHLGNIIPQVVYLPLQQGFHTKMAGNNQFKSSHFSLHPFPAGQCCRHVPQAPSVYLLFPDM